MSDGRPVVGVDANALMMPVELNIRVFEEIERLLGSTALVVPRVVLEELEHLATGCGEAATAARVGLALAADRCTTVDSGNEQADDALVTLAREGDVAYVVTNDAPLRARLLDAGIPVISLRGRTKLAIIHP